jgi:type II secretory pathway pseudopilin PulG
MFSLIITIISIALVGALALATLYYGGSSWTRGNATAAAATATNQGEQIRAAMAVYYLDHGQYPASLAELEGDYLRAIPVPPDSVAALDAPLEVGFVVSAQAASDRVWAMLAPHQPAVMIHETVSQHVCQELNFTSRGSDAIYEKVDPREAMQCFGPAGGPFTYVVGVPNAGSASASLRNAVEQYNDANSSQAMLLLSIGEENPISVAQTRTKVIAPNEDEGDGQPETIYANSVWKSGGGGCSTDYVYDSAQDLRACLESKYRVSSQYTATGVTKWFFNGSEIADPELEPDINTFTGAALGFEAVWAGDNKSIQWFSVGAWRDWTCPAGHVVTGTGIDRICQPE